MRPRWHHPALLLALVGCAGGDESTLVGCSSELAVRVPAAVTEARACVDGVCTSAVEGGVLRVPLGRREDGGRVEVEVTVAGTAYTGTVPVERTFPNGRNRPPVCVNGSAVLDVEAGRVLPG